jgi:hypothetical protein
MDWITPPEYYGRILAGPYSPELKKRVDHCLSIYRSLEEIGNPAMCYMAAWQEEDRIIWYEFASERLRKLLGCKASEVAEVFRRGVVEHRIYTYQKEESGIRKDSIDQQELTRTRKQLRQEVKRTGFIEAVYKIALPDSRTFWVKDQAEIETAPEDRICISNGCLTLISKEMEIEAERERLVLELQEALSKVKQLSGLLPICASCKKIRDDQGYWNQIEEYIRKHTEVNFSHSLCPLCVEKLYPELFKGKDD